MCGHIVRPDIRESIDRKGTGDVQVGGGEALLKLD